tara:strand:- start:927 stop:1874 length:948 start_codon:yes stop_codon:yes gene_type:complete
LLGKFFRNFKKKSDQTDFYEEKPDIISSVDENQSTVGAEADTKHSASPSVTDRFEALDSGEESHFSRKWSSNTLTIAFANSKGGVGKSTLAFISCLNLAVKQPDSYIEFIDLDRQATTQDSLKRFTNDRFCLIEDPEFLLASGGPNNARIYQHLCSDSFLKSSCKRRLVFFDTPAGTNFVEYSFLNDADYLFVPTSSSDADLFATRKFLGQLFLKDEGFSGHSITQKLPTVLVIPNLLETRQEMMHVYQSLREFPCYLGHPIIYSRLFKRTFGREISDYNVAELLRFTNEFGDWFADIITNPERTQSVPKSLFQI